ncbi:hypothetical protein [Paenibacillus arenilitoris]|uniref:Uncharacterized protein n=1 Tax=Paenibacillus arenilitoris TaxID=2772299 RepID=A0A927HA10_9BACL|nr:hypothetical protein [Paenibacillus arenilitoris]MBD2872164.1 hypothetical protein [Paenibacillus arenilitoris]
MNKAAAKLLRWTAATIVAAAWLGLCGLTEPTAAAGKKIDEVRVAMYVRASSKAEFASELRFTNRELTSALGKAAREAAPAPALLRDVELTIAEAGGGLELYRLEETGNLWKEEGRERIVLSGQAADLLLRYASALRQRHYGKLVAWEEAKELLPRKSVFSVTDIESGLTFRVQRRAGSDHADVQPLTKKDTQIMKHIYRDKWSWKRKAVLVHSDGKWVAASMNGMPHGGDGIPDNDFSGHFCIHFYLSSTHKSDQPDLAHQLMVHKAAGGLQPYFDVASPAVLAKTVVVVMNHHDPELLGQLTAGLPTEESDAIVREMVRLSSIQEQRLKKDSRESGGAGEPEQGMGTDGNLSAEVAVPVAMEARDGSRERARYLFQLKRESVRSPWRFAHASIGN